MQQQDAISVLPDRTIFIKWSSYKNKPLTLSYPPPLGESEPVLRLPETMNTFQVMIFLDDISGICKSYNCYLGWTIFLEFSYYIKNPWIKPLLPIFNFSISLSCTDEQKWGWVGNVAQWESICLIPAWLWTQSPGKGMRKYTWGS